MHHLLDSPQWFLRKRNEQVPISQWMSYLPWALVSESLRIQHEELASHMPRQCPSEGPWPPKSKILQAFKTSIYWREFLLLIILQCHILCHNTLTLCWSLLPLSSCPNCILQTLVIKISLQLIGNLKEQPQSSLIFIILWESKLFLFETKHFTGKDGMQSLRLSNYNQLPTSNLHLLVPN